MIWDWKPMNCPRDFVDNGIIKETLMKFCICPRSSMEHVGITHEVGWVEKKQENFFKNFNYFARLEMDKPGVS
jgi:hypothetical protein